MSLTFELLADVEAPVRLRDEWRALWETDPTATMFQRPEFLLTWIAEFEGPPPVLVLARRDEQLAGLAAFRVDAGVLRFLGDHEITDYLAPVGSDREAVAATLLEGMAALEGWRSAELHCLAVDTGWPGAITDAAKGAGWIAEEQRQDVCPRVSLEGGFDAYLERLPGKLRHEMLRKERRLAREAGAYTVRLSTAATLDADLELFFAMHRSSEGAKGKFLHQGMAGFFTRLAHSFEQLGALRLSWLEVGDSTLAAVLSFADRDGWRVYNSAFDHSRRALAPGMVLMSETIRLAAREGALTLDLLRGDEPYKYRFGAVGLPLVQLTLSRS
jgi:CelD/BcsL family acetyltransferase involved in cellulose biosynthesis